MATVRFTQDYNHTLASDRRVSIKYLAGKRYPVKAEWAAEFVEKGVAVREATPSRRRLRTEAPASK